MGGSKSRAAAWAWLALLALACYRGPVPEPVRQQVQTDPVAALRALEAIRAEHPRDFDVRMLLGQAHYRAARLALEAQDEAAYLQHFEQANLALIEATRIRPGAADPYVFFAMIDAYRGDMRSARRALRKAIHLDPDNPHNYTNLAQVYVFLDQPRRARGALRRAHALGGADPQIDLNELLLAWKAGDLFDARDLFNSLYGRDRGFIRSWDEARVAAPIESFEDFTRYCCSNPACGPYMRDACARADQAVAERALTLQTLRREQEIARENRAKLRGVYREDGAGRRKASDVSVEAVEPAPGAPAEAP